MLSLSAIVALVAAVIILLIGFRVYLLDRSNYQYRGFGALCALLAWMCFCWYEMEQTDNHDVAVYWRRMQSVWALSNPLIVYCCWRFASMYLRSVAIWLKFLFFGLILLPGFLFFGLEIFTELGHGKVTLLENGHWGLALDGVDGLTIARGIWTLLIYGSSIYFIYLVWREESIPFRKIWLAGLLILLTVAASLTLLQNYVAPANGTVLPINESWNTLISVFFFGWALSDFQMFDLKPESTFEHVVSSMTNLMIITNANFRIKKINPIAMSFWNTNERESRNVPLAEILGEEAAHKLSRNASMEGKQEISFGIKDNRAHILFNTSMIRNGRGRPIGYVFVGNDLTEMYQAISEIQRYNQKLETSNKSLEQFAYAVSHDLKEPLRTVLGFVNLLERKVIDQEDKHTMEYIFHINRGIERMETMIDSILSLSRLDNEAEEKRVNLERVVLEVMDKLYALCSQKKAVINYGELPVIKAKYDQINLLFQHLIENGIKYNKSLRPAVEIHWKRISGGYEFSIQDNGIGIDPKYRQEIFKLFKRLHSRSEYEGTGIGLTMCRKIIEGMGGNIWIENPENGKQGTVVKFIIPDLAEEKKLEEIKIKQVKVLD